MIAATVPDLAQVVGSIQGLPALRAVTLEVMRGLDRPDAHLETLAQKIGYDPALSASVLRVVNSPFYGLASRVESVRQASMILGTSALRSIITAAGLVNAMPMPHCREFDSTQFWLHSFTAAVWARLLAERSGANADLAYTAALLHDSGRVVLAQHFGDLCCTIAGRAAAERRPTWEVERELLGFDHGRIGAELLAHWRLPESLRAPVAEHHSPRRSTEIGTITLVRNADLVARQLESGDPAAIDAARVLLRLSADDMTELVDRAGRECEALRGLLHAGEASP